MKPRANLLVVEATKVATFFNTKLQALGYEAHADASSAEGSFIHIEIYELDDDSEPVGLLLTDLTTFQWRNVSTKHQSGSAAQGKLNARILLTQILGTK